MTHRAKFFALLSLLGCLLAGAQSPYVLPGPGGKYVFGVVAAPGQLGPYLNYDSYAAAPSNYTVQVLAAGTAPTACTYSIDGSLDAVNWVSLSGPLPCTAAGMQHIANKPVSYLRLNILTYTQGDASTQVKFVYARGTN